MPNQINPSSDGYQLYALLFESHGQNLALELMRSVSWKGQRLFGDEEIKDINREYTKARRERRKQTRGEPRKNQHA